MIINLKLFIDKNNPLSGGKNSEMVKAWKMPRKYLAIHKTAHGEDRKYRITQIQTGLTLGGFYPDNLCYGLKLYRNLVKTDNWHIDNARFGRKIRIKRGGELIKIWKNARR